MATVMASTPDPDPDRVRVRREGVICRCPTCPPDAALLYVRIVQRLPDDTVPAAVKAVSVTCPRCQTALEIV